MPSHQSDNLYLIQYVGQNYVQLNLFMLHTKWKQILKLDKQKMNMMMIFDYLLCTTLTHGIILKRCSLFCLLFSTCSHYIFRNGSISIHVYKFSPFLPISFGVYEWFSILLTRTICNIPGCVIQFD